MHFFSFAEKDATLYEGSATQSRNTGLDEILEVRKDMNADGSVVNVSRVLVKFNLANISSSTQSKDISSQEVVSPLDVAEVPPLQEVKRILKQKIIR